MAFAMANNSNPSAIAAAASCASASEGIVRLDGAAVGLMTGMPVGPAHVMNSDASGQTKFTSIIKDKDLKEPAHLCNVSHLHFETV